MRINLEIIRNLLRKTLGYDSFTAGFINAVKEDKNIPTAEINAEGMLHYNPEFAGQYIKTEADLFCLVFHEILHPAFGHFIYGNDDLVNVACDAIINSVISNLFARESGNGSLFMRLYPERGFQAILRPLSRLKHSRYSMLYDRLYPCYKDDTNHLSTGEVIETLKALSQGVQCKVLLLGSHGTDGFGKSSPWPSAVINRIAQDMLAAIRETGNGAGFYDALKKLIIKVLKPKRTIRQDLLLNYSTRRKLDAFLGMEQQARRITSPFPVNPSRRDLVLLSAGIWPGFFRNRQPEITKKQKGIALFLDVSGSVNDYLPEIIGIISGFRNRIRTIHLFSNEVVEIPFNTLCQGELQTTYGTDFDCIAKTILEKEYERAVVITDGYAGLKKENSAALKKAGSRILTILFDDKDECPEFKPFGEVVKLEEVIEE